MPTTLMGRAMLVGIAVWFINWVFANDHANTLFGSGLLKQVFDVASVLALVPLGYFGFKATRWVVRNLLWRLRQRLIVTYFLIGVLPLVLLASLVAVTGYVVFVQSSSSLVSRQLEGYITHSRSAAQAISRDLSSGEMSRMDPTQLKHELQDRVNAMASVFPELRIAMRRVGEQGFLISVTSDSSAMATAPSLSSPQQLLPPWMNDRQEFHGLVVEKNSGGRHQLVVRHVIKINTEGRLPAPAIVELSYPVGAEISRQISRTVGGKVEPVPGVLALEHVPSGHGEVAPGIQPPEPGNRNSSPGARAQRPSPTVVNEAGGEFDGYPIFMPAVQWETGKLVDTSVVVMDWAALRPGAILRSIEDFRSGSTFGGVVVYLITVLSVVFLVIASIAVISAAFLTRSITGAVHHLYQGTKRVEAGDLEHEIPTKGQDQLGALAMSFNQMTRSVRELLRVSAEKQRLDQEMNIAAEVQSRLFPRTVPKTETLDLAPGICIPARAVSGDYYDFLDIAPGVIGLVIADVCGKGMSAALLMSNLQASLRGQAQAYRDAWQERYRIAAATPEKAEAIAAPDETPTGRRRVGRIVEVVNRQIENSTSDSRYVTMFYAEIDEQSSTLRYTNAGHNAPLLLRRDSAGADPVVEKLDTGGTVLGLFSSAEYEEGELRLLSGDVLVACTDGVIEAHNPQGEEFGEDRLAGILRRNSHLPAIEIERLILQAVKNWTGGMDQEDDLTLVVLKKK
ncbi:MAG TPA: PP2C family protein-serine/threonine phosphatase [Blastocatellia bacterium]|nr:PP2C family protein-serine/threonine phosphatase [Blastocatellia bacterium]